MDPPRALREHPPQLRVVRRRKRGRALAERFEAQLLEAVRRAGRIEEIRGDRTVLDRRERPPPGGAPPPPRPRGADPGLQVAARGRGRRPGPPGPRGRGGRGAPPATRGPRAG